MAWSAKVMTLKPGFMLLRQMHGCRNPICGGVSPKLGWAAEGPARSHARVHGVIDPAAAPWCRRCEADATVAGRQADLEPYWVASAREVQAPAGRLLR